MLMRRLAAPMLLCLLLSACQSAGKDMRSFSVSSTPKGASVQISGSSRSCRTPCKINLPKETKSVAVTIKKPGCVTFTASVRENDKGALEPSHLRAVLHCYRNQK